MENQHPLIFVIGKHRQIISNHPYVKRDSYVAPTGQVSLNSLKLQESSGWKKCNVVSLNAACFRTSQVIEYDNPKYRIIYQWPFWFDDKSCQNLWWQHSRETSWNNCDDLSFNCPLCVRHIYDASLALGRTCYAQPGTENRTSLGIHGGLIGDRGNGQWYIMHINTNYYI